MLQELRALGGVLKWIGSCVRFACPTTVFKAVKGVCSGWSPPGSLLEQGAGRKWSSADQGRAGGQV